MPVNYKQSGSLNSAAEDLFVELFCDTFGPDKSQYLFLQYPFTDIYGNRRFIDFALESEDVKIAIEIDGETYHNPYKVSNNKYYDDLTKQNSLIYQNWNYFKPEFTLGLTATPNRADGEDLLEVFKNVAHK